MAKKSGKAAKTATKKKVPQPPKATRRPVKLSNVWQLTQAAWRTFWQNKRLFIGITLIYGLLNLLLVRGLAGGTDVSSLKHTLNQVFTGNFGSVTSALSVFVVLVGSAGNGSSQTAGAYQLSLGIITSLAIIWGLRQVLAGTPVRIRDAYYRGMYPLVPFVLVLLVIGLQLIPMLIGSGVYSAVVTGGIAVNFIEKLFFAGVFALLALVSLYLVASSVFALYIVTLPDMTPVKALHSARELVRHRRWTVLRKLLCLPVILLIVAAVIMVPIIILLTPLAQWIFFLMTMFALVAIHAYIYTLYRELLNE